MSDSARLEEGVMGYQERKVTPPNIAPSAAAWFPSMRIFPSVLFLRSTRKGAGFRFCAAYSAPTFTAARFMSSALGFRPSWAVSERSTSWKSIPRIWETTPT